MDLISTIKTVIEGEKRNSGPDGVDAQRLAELIAVAVEYAGWKSPDEVRAELDASSLPPPPEKD